MTTHETGTREAWLAVRSGWVSSRAFWTRYGIHGHRPLRKTRAEAIRQLLEAQLANCVAFCRACAEECGDHREMHRHCGVCADACTECAEACAQMLSTMRLPA